MDFDFTPEYDAYDYSPAYVPDQAYTPQYDAYDYSPAYSPSYPQADASGFDYTAGYMQQDPAGFDYTASYTQQDSPGVQTQPAEQPASWGRESRSGELPQRSNSAEYTEPSGKEPAGAFSEIMKSMGLDGKLTDPKTLESWMKLLMSGGSMLNTLNRRGTAQNGQTPRQIQASMPGQEYSKFTPQQQAFSDKYFNTQATPWQQRERMAAASMASPIVPGRKYADGGDVAPGGLAEMFEQAAMQQEPNAPFAGMVQGPGGGQDDLINAKLAAGEYVFDADVVSALGDGDNARGADILDEFRRNIRTHKRGADPEVIPPMAAPPEQYLPEGALQQTMMMGGE